MCVPGLVWRSECLCKIQSISFTIWISRTELRSSGLVASTFTCWAILLAPYLDLLMKQQSIERHTRGERGHQQGREKGEAARVTLVFDGGLWELVLET